MVAKDFAPANNGKPQCARIFFERAEGQRGMRYRQDNLPLDGNGVMTEALFVSENDEWLDPGGSSYRVAVADEVAGQLGAHAWIFIIVHRFDNEHLLAVLQFVDRLRRRLPVEKLRIVFPVVEKAVMNDRLERLSEVASLISPSGMSWLWYGKIIGPEQCTLMMSTTASGGRGDEESQAKDQQGE
jgi:hypothetical protein